MTRPIDVSQSELEEFAKRFVEKTVEVKFDDQNPKARYHIVGISNTKRYSGIGSQPSIRYEIADGVILNIWPTTDIKLAPEPTS